MKNLFLFSSLPKFTFSSSEFVQNKKTKVQINKNQMHTLSFLSQGFSLIHQLYSGSKRIFYLLHIYGLCTTTGYVFKKKSILSFKYKMCPSLVAKTCLRQKSVHSGSNSGPALSQSRFYYYYSQPFWILLQHCAVPPPQTLKYLATIAAGAGPGVRSAQGEE